MQIRTLVSKALLDAVMKPRNALIIGLGIILSVLLQHSSYVYYPVVFGAIFFIFSTLYTLFFETKQTQYSKDDNEDLQSIRRLIQERNDNLSPILIKIFHILESFESVDVSHYAIVSRYMVDILAFEKVIPELVRNYRNAADFISEREFQFDNDLMQLKTKLREATHQKARETYQRAIQEKEEAGIEVERIYANMEACESNLHFILSGLEKIEATIASAKLSNGVNSKDTEKLTEQFEVFSQSIKNISKNIEF